MAEAEIDLDSVIDRLLEGEQSSNRDGFPPRGWLSTGVACVGRSCVTLVRARCRWLEGWNGGDRHSRRGVQASSRGLRLRGLWDAGSGVDFVGSLGWNCGLVESVRHRITPLRCAGRWPTLDLNRSPSLLGAEVA